MNNFLEYVYFYSLSQETVEKEVMGEPGQSKAKEARQYQRSGDGVRGEFLHTIKRRVDWDQMLQAICDL